MIYSYVAKTVEQGGWTGVCRFDSALRSIFPDIQSVTQLPELNPGAAVVTDNHLSLHVPENIKTIVVHHGCSQCHYDRDKNWRNSNTEAMTAKQKQMFTIANRTFIAPSAWVAEQFASLRLTYPEPAIIPHWVESIPSLPKSGRPKIIGDWRDNNKGSGVWRKLAERCPQWEFQPLNFRDDAGRRKQYGEADLYLCLSLSEGGSYSMCDAEAASLPVVTTDVGNYREFDDCEVIPWKDRDNLDLVAAAIDRKLHKGRRKPSFYREYDFGAWAGLWRGIVP